VRYDTGKEYMTVQEERKTRKEGKVGGNDEETNTHLKRVRDARKERKEKEKESLQVFIQHKLYLTD